MSHSTANNYLFRSTLKIFRQVRYSPTLYSWRSHPCSLLTFFSRDWWQWHTAIILRTPDTIILGILFVFLLPWISNTHVIFLNNSLYTFSSSFLRKGLQEVSFKKIFFVALFLWYLFLSIFSLGKFCHWMLTFFIGLLIFFSSLYFIFQYFGERSSGFNSRSCFYPLNINLFEHSDPSSRLQWSFTSVMILTF